MKKHSSLPEPYPTILSLYITNLLNGQTIYLDKQPAHWCVHFCVGFLFFVRFQLSAALSLIFRSVADTLPLLCSIAEDVLLPALHLGKVKVWARHPPVDVLDVVASGLKVSCGVVRAGDENLKEGGRYVSLGQTSWFDSLIRQVYKSSIKYLIIIWL